MEAEQFSEFATSMVDYITNYLENIRDRRVLPIVEPGYLRPLIPSEAPETAEKWQDIMDDIERVIMPGVTHWHSPHFHGYFSAANSYPAIVADMLSDAIACIGFSWIASPACTELEVVMLDWLGKMLELPAPFLASSGGKGGGIIQGSASEATLLAVLGAKVRIIRNTKLKHPDWTDDEIISKIVCYGSDQAHSSVERAGLLAGVKFTQIETDDQFQMRGDNLKRAIISDKKSGLIPCCVVATLGTTNCCAFDCLDEIGPVCEEEEVWLHVDAAYAGSAFICPENRYLMNGVEFVDSFNISPHKWLLVTFDCSAMWLKDPSDVINIFNVDPLYLKQNLQGCNPDYRYWQIPWGRRFRALKIWFVLRLYGIEKLQMHIRRHISLAHEFENYVRSDDRFEIFFKVIMGLVCFRLKGSNEMNETLLKKITAKGKVYLVPAKIRNIYFLRFAICSRYTESSDIKGSWEEVQAIATEVLAEGRPGN